MKERYLMLYSLLIIINLNSLSLENNGVIVSSTIGVDLDKDKTTYINKGVIKVNEQEIFGSELSNKDETSGIKGESDINFSNEGVIMSKSSKIGTDGHFSTFDNKSVLINTLHGNGISLTSENITLQNEGLVEGNFIGKTGTASYTTRIESTKSGNGMLLSNAKLNLNNVAVIKGESFLKSGDISKGSSPNMGIDEKENGNGILFGDISGEATNSGVIKGKSLTKLADVQTSGATGMSIGTHQESGNGLSSTSQNKILEKIENNGVVKGEKHAYGYFSSYEQNHRTSLSIRKSGNGINLMSNGTQSLNIENSGSILGFASVHNKNGNETMYFADSGNGINIVGTSIDSFLENNGLIGGKVYVNKSASNPYKPSIARSGYSIVGIKNTVNNGILFGNNILSGVETSENAGVYIKLEDNGNIKEITNGSGGLVTLKNSIQKEVLNAEIKDIDGKKNSYFTIEEDSKFQNKIFNGAGVRETEEVGSLTVVKSDVEIDNSIINAYETALFLKDGSKVSLNDTIVNGGKEIFDSTNEATVKSSIVFSNSGSNSLDISGNSIINGDISLNGDNESLTIGNSVQINGNIYSDLEKKLKNGEEDRDTLNLGISTNDKVLNIYHSIKGFENLNTNGDITLFETAKVEGAENIVLESGNLLLRVDPTITSDGKITGHALYGTSDGKITGHALYGNSGTLTSSGGNLVFGLNGLGENSQIYMGQTKIDTDIDNKWWLESDKVKTNSLVLDAKVQENGEIVDITVKELIDLFPSTPVEPEKPEEPEKPVEPETPKPAINNDKLYVKLNKIYKSIVSAKEIGKLANTTLITDVEGESYLETVRVKKSYDDSLKGLLIILDQIYANNPYAYTLKSSRDSLKLFEDRGYLTINPEKERWLVQGKAIQLKVNNEVGDTGKNYHGFDTFHRTYKTKSSIYGGVATLQYGLSDNNSIGMTFGANNQDILFKGNNKIDSTSIYLGSFLKANRKDFELITGLGYQNTKNDVKREVANQYDKFQTYSNYDVNAFEASIEGRYKIKLEDWSLQPKIKLAYYYIRQDNINEDYSENSLNINVDKNHINTTDLEVGAELVKPTFLKFGKLNSIFSYSYIKTFGDISKELSGNIKGEYGKGSKFDIRGARIPEDIGKMGYDLELKTNTGVIYSFGLGYEFSTNGNRDLSAKISLGYIW